METLRLVNKYHGLSADYVPMKLVQDSSSTIWLCEVTYEAFQKVNKRLLAEGLEPLVLISGYRPYTYQKKLYEKKVQIYLNEGLDEGSARKKASQIVALPGHSEHQLGLAIDVSTCSMKHLEDPLIEAFEEMPTGAWMAQNAYMEGFILRYPKDKIAHTNITYEPWHYRYVGKEAAVIMHKLGLCLEEYLFMYQG